MIFSGIQFIFPGDNMKEQNSPSKIIKNTRNFKRELHSFHDEPSVVDGCGDRYWYKNSQFHRDIGPAVIQVDGNEFWCYEGKQIR